MKYQMSILLKWMNELICKWDWKKNKRIDKYVQKQINRDREHWRNVLLKIIAVVKTLGKIS